MPDNILLLIFGVLSTIAFAFGGLSLYFAFRAAKKPDGEIQMVLWGVAGLGGLTFGGMAWAYFIIPILINRFF
ncbi:MAG TPA: hypothetical protein VNN76_03905 [Bacteroidota bacterium]|nr:hypothetical protein [Bacteroidota bacterium]